MKQQKSQRHSFTSVSALNTPYIWTSIEPIKGVLFKFAQVSCNCCCSKIHNFLSSGGIHWLNACLPRMPVAGLVYFRSKWAVTKCNATKVVASILDNYFTLSLSNVFSLKLKQLSSLFSLFTHRANSFLSRLMTSLYRFSLVTQIQIICKREVQWHLITNSPSCTLHSCHS